MASTSFNTLLEHQNQFLGFVQRRVQDLATAEDILQAAYVRALQHEGELQAQESVVGWSYRVLRNTVIDLYRRRASEDKALERWGREIASQVVPSHEIQNEICVYLSRVMNTIKPDYAEVLRSVDLGEQRLHDFAQEHDISESNAAVRLHRARASFRKHLVQPAVPARSTVASIAHAACNFSPMGVLWSSIGASPAYEVFAGMRRNARRNSPRFSPDHDSRRAGLPCGPGSGFHAQHDL